MVGDIQASCKELDMLELYSLLSYKSEVGIQAEAEMRPTAEVPTDEVPTDEAQVQEEEAGAFAETLPVSVPHLPGVAGGPSAAEILQWLLACIVARETFAPVVLQHQLAASTFAEERMSLQNPCMLQWHLSEFNHTSTDTKVATKLPEVQGPKRKFTFSGLDVKDLECHRYKVRKPGTVTYECGYCSVRKTSSSAGRDGYVRIRCECGGKHRDSTTRLHAKWDIVETSKQKKQNLGTL